MSNFPNGSYADSFNNPETVEHSQKDMEHIMCVYKELRKLSTTSRYLEFMRASSPFQLQVFQIS